MRVITIHMPAAGFGGVLGAMRDWLNRHKSDPVKFETRTEASGMILVRVEFDRVDLAEAFQRDFDAVPGIERRIGLGS